MKRAHAKQLIERYFYQLSSGCGNPHCLNKNCASSGQFAKLTPNQAAARAIQLFSEDAKFCDFPANKTARISDETDSATQSSIANAETIGCINEDNYSESTVQKENQDNISVNLLNSSVEIPNSVSCNQSQPLLSSSNASTATTTKMNRRTQLALETLPYMDEQVLNQLIDYCKKNNTFAPLIRNLGRYFSSREYLVQSFQKRHTSACQHISKLIPKATARNLKHQTKEEFRALEGDLDKDKDESGVTSEDDELSSGNGKNDTTRLHNTSVDLKSLRRSMTHLLETKASAFDSLNNALQSLALSISVDLRMLTQREKIEEIITVFVIIFEIIIIGKSDFVDVALPTVCKAASYLPIWAQARLACIWAHHCKDGLRKLLETIQQLISLQVITGTYHENRFIQDNEHIINATKLMKIVYYASILAGKLDSSKLREEDADSESMLEDDSLLIYSGSKKSSSADFTDALAEELQVNVLDCRKPYIPFEEFYNEPLSDAIEMDNDYLYYKNRQGDKRFSFMLYSFILTPATKTLGLYYDCRIRMYNERRFNSFHTQLAGQPSNPYLKLKVRRDHIIDDALVELEIVAMGNPKDLKKQLVVEFVGEQGIDEGGVSKEFFQMIVEEIFNPDYGMFIQQETRTVWFNSTSFENEAQFTLIGIVLGLAIYNNIILAVNFPMVVYRKLMGIKGSFTDLADWNPVLYKSLQDILDYDGDDIEDVFMQTFQISYQDVFGNIVMHDLKENGDTIYVNQTNKQEFVDLYTDYLLNTSIEKKFRAFRRGFQMVTDESPLHLLFRPEEVELLVCGSKEFDFNELEKATEYEGGYTEKSQIIIDFWDIVHGLSLESKKKLLEFTTGSDRVPVGGMSRLKLVIARNGSDSENTDRLPTSHTCYNVLLLPEYKTREKLEERLLKAINYSKGFGMI
ncbi:ubiquitin-protein ligase E3A isoform X2 [Sitodiplosis mosellana]|nr:ubiquitin-protein ligase E3A isoform X2 [Sitodiplosis mosellana]XP_055316658.1 ubiquitin-protein ligase E3A isoform X2 [Sitodiplosis mosellana]XP_055316659.1 ubiquitin-protein ligase E3A isoform X2 [Sitodiplosis mosellana]